MDGFLVALPPLAALGCGLVAGVFFALSSFVMKALGRLAPAQGFAAMQAINAAGISFAFMLALFGTAVGCAALIVWALLDGTSRSPLTCSPPVRSISSAWSS